MTARMRLLRAAANLAILLVVVLARPAFALDRIEYCNAVQNKVGFIRYPLGEIAAWSNASGEMADVMTRVPRIYPCLGSVVLRPPREDWRASVAGDPSMLVIQYQTNKPCGASTAAITVAPHVSIFRVTFPAEAQNKYLVFELAKGPVDNWASLYHWTNRTLTRVDARTIEVTVGSPGKTNAWYLIRFDTPAVGGGTIEASGTTTEGASRVAGSEPAMYARFQTSAVTVSIAQSFTSAQRAAEHLAAEAGDFEAIHQKCRAAWGDLLNRVELQGSETSQRMAYTALYTMLANVIDGSDGSCYRPYYSRPRSVASSAYWQFIGGYQSCCWDNVRATYPFLSLVYPEVMTDVLHTYLARYQRDGCMDGDICLISGPLGHRNIRLLPVLIAQACYAGVLADYSKIYAALKDNFRNATFVPPSLTELGYMTQSIAGGFACSRTLEFTTGLQGMAVLAKVNHDADSLGQYLRGSKAYTNLWDSANQAFRLKHPDGSWGPIENAKMTWNPNPQGLFEGTTRDWMFAIPHDPYGLIELPGQQGLVDRVIDYCTNGCWFNDYQLAYPLLLYYAGAPNAAQRIQRRSWVPLFAAGVMYEGVRPKPPHNGWQTHYTGNSGWLMCSLLGLYPAPSPPGQFVITSPSVNSAVLHRGSNAFAVRTVNNSERNIYIKSIKLDGKVFPSYMVSAKRLAAGARLELEMGDDPASGLGDLYVGSSDGFIVEAELGTPSRLKCTVAAAAMDATTKIWSRRKPAKVRVDGREANPWSYDEAKQTVNIHTTGTATIEVSL